MLEDRDIFSILFPLLKEALEELVVREIATMPDERIQEIRHKYGSKKLEET